MLTRPVAPSLHVGADGDADHGVEDTAAVVELANCMANAAGRPVGTVLPRALMLCIVGSTLSVLVSRVLSMPLAWGADG